MTVTHLFDHQVDALVNAVRALANSHGKDSAARDTVRKQVAGELMNRERPHVVHAALSGLYGEPGRELLERIVRHHRETFYIPDRTLSAVVVPIGVRFRSHGQGDVQLAAVRAETVDGLARALERELGSRKAVFDTRLYEGDPLFYCRPNQLLAFLRRLEAGEPQPEGGPAPTAIRSNSDPDWRLVYLLGVEVNEPGATPALNTDDAQRLLVGTRLHAEWALSEASGLRILRTASRADVRCLGFWYLNRGVLEGETWLRGAQLYALMNGFDQGIGGVKFHYARDESNGHVRLLITSDLMTVEYRWKLFSGEGMEGFLEELDTVIARLVAADGVLVKEEVHLYDYETIARKAGLVWVGGE